MEQKYYYAIRRTHITIGGQRHLDERTAKVTDLEEYRRSIKQEFGEEAEINFTYETIPMPEERTKIKLTIKYERETL